MSVISSRPGRAFVLLSLTSVLVAPAAVRAQGAAGLPAAKDLIAKYAAAVGADTWKKHKSARMKATMEMGAGGMSGNIELVQIFPNAVAQKLIVPGMGEIRTGFDGTVAWAVDPMQGPQVLTGPRADQARDDADPENSLRLSANITSSETLEKTTVEGKECYKVKHTWKSGRVVTDCYAVSDGLLVSTSSKQVGPMGEVETTQYQSDYKDFGGLKRPTTIRQDAMGQQVTIRLTGWEWDNVDPKELELPPEIKALAGKKP